MIKNPHEIDLMRAAGRRLASVFEMLDEMDLQGLSTLQINDLVERFICDHLKARPASKGHYGFKYALNCSINDEVCHGIPSVNRIVAGGDIINLDITLEKDGFIADSSKTFMVGKVSPEALRVVNAAREAMWAGIRVVRPGAHMGDIGFAIEKTARKHGCSVVREFCGHGIGREMHEEPYVPHYGRRGKGMRLREGMTFTVEPLINLGKRKTVMRDDGWTVVTKDGKLSAQFEHTLAVTADGVEVLTLRKDERA